jgi:outer membrane protein assembly factor BamB
MNTKLGRRAALTLFPAALLAGCDTPKPKIAGTQIPVLPALNGLIADVDAPAVQIPAPAALADWPQVYAGPAHAPGNVAGPASVTPGWSVNIGKAGGYRQPLLASPLVAEGRVFAMDANATVSAYAAASGAQQWSTDTRPKHNSAENIGGGIGYSAGTLYASTGYAELLALDPASGNIKWRQALDYPARSAPTIAGGVVAVVTQNDLLLTFDAGSGAPGWRFIGKVMDSPTSVAVAGAPAYDSGIFVAGFSSGTLAGLDAPSGTPIWEQSLASTFGQASPLDFSDIVAAPVISGGVVYAIGLGQTMQAIDLRAGVKVWDKNASGMQTVCAAGGFLFVLDTAQTLAAIHDDDGLVSWTVQLPVYLKPKKKKQPILWSGPVMVNGFLVLTNNQGEMAMVDPATGSMTSTTKLAAPADLPPIAAGGALLVLTRDATLTSYA